MLSKFQVFCDVLLCFQGVKKGRIANEWVKSFKKEIRSAE